MLNSFFSVFFLGLDAELYYVRNDLISHYALSFNLLVPSETNFLHFTWHAKSKVRGAQPKMPRQGHPGLEAEARAVSEWWAAICTKGSVGGGLWQYWVLSDLYFKFLAYSSRLSQILYNEGSHHLCD